MKFDKIRILGSSFTDEEYHLYRLDQLKDPENAVRFMSHRQNNAIFRPAVNRGFQQHFLEDKWVTQVFLANLNLPVAKTHGLFHPQFGTTMSGAPMSKSAHLIQLIEEELPLRLVFKPRGGRKGRNIILADIAKGNTGTIEVRTSGGIQSLDVFLTTLPQDAFDDYEGCYHGWLVQEYIQQHSFMNEINPHTVNSIRVVTFIDSANNVQVHLAALRLGRQGSVADNWDKGGISVFIDPQTGILGRGVFKPRYGGAWVSRHPDTDVRFEGERLPEWASVVALCQQAAATLSGIRAVGWDIALTPDGPMIIEGNATWGLPVVQVHTRGILTPEFRRELTQLGAQFPERLRPLPLALLALLVYQWQRSRGPRIVQRWQQALMQRFPFP